MTRSTTGTGATTASAVKFAWLALLCFCSSCPNVWTIPQVTANPSISNSFSIFGIHKQHETLQGLSSTTSSSSSKSLSFAIRARGGASNNPFFSPRTPPNVTPGQQQQQQQQSSSTMNPFAAGTTTTSPSTPSQTSDAEDTSTKDIIDSFLTRESRNSFIARVYAILSVQLVITAAAVVLFGVQPTLSNLTNPRFLQRNPQLQILLKIPVVSLAISSIAWFIACLNPEARRRSPTKWWLLTVFTLGEAITVGFVSSVYKFHSVVTAMGATAISAITVSAYTILQNNPNRDLSQWGASLSSWAMILLIYMLIGAAQQIGWMPAIMPYNEMFVSGISACLFSAFLAYHTKLVVSGKHSKYQMNEKDYVYGAMTLYSDIVNIFLNLLRILGEDKGD